MDSERSVYLDGRGHPQNGERTSHGHSIGRWDGNTLVIDTTNFADHSDGNFLTAPSGGGKLLIERLTLTEDGRHLQYDIELRDPECLEAPVTHSALLDYHPELGASGLPCDPEAARRFLTEQWRANDRFHYAGTPNGGKVSIVLEGSLSTTCSSSFSCSGRRKSYSPGDGGTSCPAPTAFVDPPRYARHRPGG